MCISALFFFKQDREDILILLFWLWQEIEAYSWWRWLNPAPLVTVAMWFNSRGKQEQNLICVYSSLFINALFDMGIL